MASLAQQEHQAAKCSPFTMIRITCFFLNTCDREPLKHPLFYPAHPKCAYSHTDAWSCPSLFKPFLFLSLCLYWYFLTIKIFLVESKHFAILFSPCKCQSKGAIRSHHYTWMMGGASHSRLSWTFSCCLSVHTQGRTAMDTLNSCYQVTRLHPPLNVNNCVIECKVWSVLVCATHMYINLNPYIKPTRPSSSCQLSHI